MSIRQENVLHSKIESKYTVGVDTGVYRLTSKKIKSHKCPLLSFVVKGKVESVQKCS